MSTNYSLFDDSLNYTDDADLINDWRRTTGDVFRFRPHTTPKGGQWLDISGGESYENEVTIQASLVSFMQLRKRQGANLTITFERIKGLMVVAQAMLLYKRKGVAK